MKQVKLPSGYAITFLRKQRDKTPAALARVLTDKYGVCEGDEVLCYTGLGDWGIVSRPSEYAEVLRPLIEAILALGAVPILNSCGCVRQKKDEVAKLLGIEVRHGPHGRK